MFSDSEDTEVPRASECQSLSQSIPTNNMFDESDSETETQWPADTVSFSDAETQWPAGTVSFSDGFSFETVSSDSDSSTKSISILKRK